MMHLRSLRRVVSAVAGLFALLAVATPAVAASNPPVALTLTAMKDKIGKTHVALTVTSTVRNQRPPAAATNLKVSAFSPSGATLATHQSRSLSLQTSRVTSSTSLTLQEPVPSASEVGAQLEVQISGATHKLATRGPVKLRPDLRVDSIRVASSVVAGQPAAITVGLSELNGQLGATTTLILKTADGELLRSERVNVAAAGTATVTLTAIFPKAGRQTLTVLTDNVRPGDYDASNNRRAVAVEVIGGGASTVQLALDYSAAVDREMLSEWEEKDVAAGRQTLIGSHETYTAQLTGLPTITAGKIDRIVIAFGGDGAFPAGLEFSASAVSAYGASVALSPTASLHIAPGDGAYEPGDPVHDVTIRVDYAPGDFVWLSEQRDLTTGAVSQDSFSPTDVLLLPTKTADVRVLVTIAGKTYGGRLAVPIKSEQVEYEQSGEDGEYSYAEYDYFLLISGSGVQAVAP